jgi:hypothetical protein
MKLLLIPSPVQERKKRVKPVDHFQKCPACGCKELIDVKPDVLCSLCDWDSTAWDVSRGGMDNLHSAAKEFGFSVMETVTGGKSDTALHARINQTQPEVEGA